MDIIPLLEPEIPMEASFLDPLAEFSLDPDPNALLESGGGGGSLAAPSPPLSPTHSDAVLDNQCDVSGRFDLALVQRDWDVDSDDGSQSSGSTLSWPSSDSTEDMGGLFDWDICQTVCNWSFEDIRNNNLLTHILPEKIPDIFETSDDYFSTFRALNLEEARAQICQSLFLKSELNFRQILVHEKQSGVRHLKISLADLESAAQLHTDLMPQTLVLFSSCFPRTQLFENPWAVKNHFFGIISHLAQTEREGGTVYYHVQVFHEMNPDLFAEDQTWFFAGVESLTTLRRIANATSFKQLPTFGGTILDPRQEFRPLYQADCGEGVSPEIEQLIQGGTVQRLNESQRDAVRTCIEKERGVVLLQGPPGTGKTSTIAALLEIYRRLGQRTIVCAPTNVAVCEIAQRLVASLLQTDPGGDLSDILVLGVESKIKQRPDSNLDAVYLNSRVKRLKQAVEDWDMLAKQVEPFVASPSEVFAAFKQDPLCVPDLPSNASFFSFFRTSMHRFCQRAQQIQTNVTGNDASFPEVLGKAQSAVTTFRGLLDQLGRPLPLLLQLGHLLPHQQELPLRLGHLLELPLPLGRPLPLQLGHLPLLPHPLRLGLPLRLLLGHLLPLQLGHQLQLAPPLQHQLGHPLPLPLQLAQAVALPLPLHLQL